MALFQLYNIDPTLEDRWEKLTMAQEGTIKDIQDQINSHQIALMVRPTGFGKTHIMIEFAKRQKYKKVLFIYPTDIIRQSVIAEYHPTEEKLSTKKKEIKFILSESEREKYPDLPHIEFCSYRQMLEDFNNIYRLIGDKPWDKMTKTEKIEAKNNWFTKSVREREELKLKWVEDRFKDIELLILDEAHRCGAEGFMSYWPYIHQLTQEGKKDTRLHVLGATGTPLRTVEDVDIEEDIFYYTHGIKRSARIRDFGFEDCWKYAILKRPYFIRGILNKEKEKIDIMSQVEAELRATSGLTKSKIESQLIEINDDIDDLMFNIRNVPELLVSGVNHIQPGTLQEGVYMRFMVFHADTEDMVAYSKDIDKMIHDAFADEYGYNKINSYHIISDTVNIREKLSSIGAKISSVDIIAERDKLLKNDPSSGYNTIDIIHSIDMLNMGYHVGRVTGVITRRKTSSEIIYYQQIGRCMSVKDNNQPLIIDLANAAAELNIRAVTSQRTEAAHKIQKFIDGCIQNEDQNNLVDNLYKYTGMYINNQPLPDELLEFWYIDRQAPIYFIWGISRAMMKNETLGSIMIRLHDICEDNQVPFVLDTQCCIKDSNINKTVLKSYVNTQPDEFNKHSKKSRKI